MKDSLIPATTDIAGLVAKTESRYILTTCQVAQEMYSRDKGPPYWPEYHQCVTLDFDVCMQHDICKTVQVGTI